MFVDRMHSEAIADADKYSLPQTVFRIGNDFDHTEATTYRLRSWANYQYTKAVPIVTWLPVGFFN